MRKYPILLFAVCFIGLIGCAPNLVVQDATIDFSSQTINITVKNIGDKAAGEHLTYVEINEVGAIHSAKPQSQLTSHVSGIGAGSSWSTGEVPFSSFSSPRGLDLTTLTTANLVVRADAKNMVKESNEGDNIYDADH
ncbi:hypothetical protein HQ531_06060 [bacterium]|nr:hypothetical protein [bacterium]